MRVLFLGTPQFAIPSLERLLNDSRFEIVGAVTQPDRPAGRGHRLKPPPVKELAESAGLPILQPPSLRKDPNALEWVSDLSPDLMVVVAYGQILPERFFRLPRYGALNVHASLLPGYRGAAPAAWAIMNGETLTGVSIMLIEKGLDTGDVLSRVEVPIGENDTCGDLERVLARRGAELLCETIPDYVSGLLRPSPQDHDRATVARSLQKSDGRLDWNWTAACLHNRIRGVHPWPGGQARFRGREIKIWESRLGPSDSSSGKPGEIVDSGRDGIVVSCGKGTRLRLLQVQPPNRKRVSAADFCNGFAVRTGEVFG